MLQMISNLRDALAVAFPLMVLLTGTILHTFAPHYRVIIEERVKDQAMTETEARHSLRFVRWSAPAMTVLGGVLTALLIGELFL